VCVRAHADCVLACARSCAHGGLLVQNALKAAMGEVFAMDADKLSTRRLKRRAQQRAARETTRCDQCSDTHDRCNSCVERRLWHQHSKCATA
jgi:hypothetical protein